MKSPAYSPHVNSMSCVDKGPRHINIPAVLESVVENLEGSGFEERVAIARQMFRQT
jgi:uncharacterized protein